MGINLFTIKNNNSKTSFGSGMTPQIMQKIQTCDIADISNKLADKNIKSDFQNNKVVAWCSEKVVNIFEEMNKKFHTTLSLPNEIKVEDFNNLKNECDNFIGLCNYFPSKIYKNSNEIISGKSVFFNSFDTKRANASQNIAKYYDWNNINDTSD